MLENLDAVLVDHAHLERKAAQSALKLQRYQQLADSLPELTEIAIEELEHFNLVLRYWMTGVWRLAKRSPALGFPV